MNKRSLYESIMKEVAVYVKRSLNENIINERSYKYSTEAHLGKYFKNPKEKLYDNLLSYIENTEHPFKYINVSNDWVMSRLLRNDIKHSELFSMSILVSAASLNKNYDMQKLGQNSKVSEDSILIITDFSRAETSILADTDSYFKKLIDDILSGNSKICGIIFIDDTNSGYTALGPKMKKLVGNIINLSN